MMEVVLLAVVRLFVYKLTETLLIVLLKWMTFMAYKLYLNKAIKSGWALRILNAL